MFEVGQRFPGVLHYNKTPEICLKDKPGFIGKYNGKTLLYSVLGDLESNFSSFFWLWLLNQHKSQVYFYAADLHVAAYKQFTMMKYISLTLQSQHEFVCNY